MSKHGGRQRGRPTKTIHRLLSFLRSIQSTMLSNLIQSSRKSFVAWAFLEKPRKAYTAPHDNVVTHLSKAVITPYCLRTETPILRNFATVLDDLDHPTIEVS